MTVGRALVGRQQLCITRRLSGSFALPTTLKTTRPASLGRTLSAFHAHQYTLPPTAPVAGRRRLFQSEAEFHPVADETLHRIQDALEEIFEEIRGDEDMEVSVASGVLTLSLPPHGTWVINKQTPNRQLWWSSPISGPRRYEYEDGHWVYTRSMDSGGAREESSTLGAALAHEIKELYNVDLEIDI